MKKKRAWLWIILLLTLLAIPLSYLLSGAEKLHLTPATRAGLPGSFAELPSGVTHYELSGDPAGPLVVLIHGFSVPYYIYDPTVPDLVANGFSVLRYDLYGRGYSDRPETDYSLDLYLTQLTQLLDHLALDQPLHIIGLSQGAPVAAAFANRNPDQVETLTIIDPLITPVQPKDILPMGLSLVGEYITRVVLVPHILPAAQSDDLHHPENHPDWELRYRDQLRYKGFTRAILSSIRHLPQMQPMREYIAVSDAGIPIQLIWGRHDQTIPYTDIERFMAQIPETHLHIIEDAGHIPHFEHPDIVNPLLITFLK
jgi:pimeloyl-ACP methyl ester carboxylesterase